MTTIIEEKMDLLIKLADSKYKLVPKEELKDELVQSFLADFQTDPLIRNVFLNKIEITRLVDYYQKGWLTFQNLQDFFTAESTKESKIIEILRKFSFDQRKIILDKLVAIDEEKFASLEEKIDTKYGMINGVLIKDVSQKPKQIKPEDQFYDLLKDENVSLELYKQFVDSLARNKPQDFIEIINGVKNVYPEVFEKAKTISSKEEFTLVVKISYLLSYKIEEYQELVTNLELKLIRTLQGFQSGNDINTIINQLPQVFIKDILVRLDRETRVKNFELRNEAMKLKTESEKYFASFLNIKKCIEENGLNYTIIK